MLKELIQGISTGNYKPQIGTQEIWSRTHCLNLTNSDFFHIVTSVVIFINYSFNQQIQILVGPVVNISFIRKEIQRV